MEIQTSTEERDKCGTNQCINLIETVSVFTCQWRIQAPPAPPSTGPKSFVLHTFSPKSAHVRGRCPPNGQRSPPPPPPTGNPRSATARTKFISTEGLAKHHSFIKTKIQSINCVDETDLHDKADNKVNLFIGKNIFLQSQRVKRKEIIIKRSHYTLLI